MRLTAKSAKVRLSNTYRGGDRLYVEFTGNAKLVAAFEKLPLRTQLTKLRDACEPAMLKLAGVPSSTTMSWSKHAGCKMCSCSPGFILEGQDNGRDIWVTIDITKDA